MRSEPIFPVFFSHNINIHFLSTESNCPMITERFAVIWLAVTFHVQSLSADKCAILGNSINNLMFSEWGGGGSEGQKRKLIQNANDHSRRLRSSFRMLASFIVLSTIFFLMLASPFGRPHSNSRSLILHYETGLMAYIRMHAFLVNS